MKTLIAVLLVASTALAQRNLKTDEDLRGAKHITVILKLGAVDLGLRKSNDPSKAFKIFYSYSEEEKVPRLSYDVDGDEGTFRLSNNKGDADYSFWRFHNTKDSVNLELSQSVPMSMTANFGVCDANVDLGGMKVTDAAFSTGVCSFSLNFSTPNQIQCEKVTIKAGISSISVNDFANARAKSIDLEGGIGSIKVDFGGKFTTDCDVRIKTGLGSVDISIPSDINTTITTPESFLTGVDVAGFYSEGGGVYRSKMTTGPYLHIMIESGMGGVNIKSY